YPATTVDVLKNEGAGGFRRTRSYEIGLEGTSLATGRLRRPDVADLIVAGETNQQRYLSILKNADDGTFSAPELLPSGNSFGSGAHLVLSADLNFDGLPDLVAGESGGVSLLLNEGAGKLANAVSWQIGPYPAWIAVADLDGD